ncbi:DUF1533 domain-containing protein [Bacillus mesophilum]|uniref:DUF1533 domain-containing protein n=1 Tax=Bacillus mesophilum TaxID=1071718 RepID=A0A7V7UXD0_9BACI|nr:DUF1533 domain-containing protein [Bacillus mesophilum]KAB2332578.1 DUF1533 domain-containing protein [Bacillus mesophilum]
MSFNTPTINYFSGNDPEYFSKITSISLDGIVLTESDYTVDDRGIEVFFSFTSKKVEGQLDKEGIHTITIKATGYEDATVNVVPDWS